MVIIPRDEWCTEPPNVTPGSISLPAPRLWLHHGASGISTIATANAYARYHIRTLGWHDIGYSFLIANGKVLEGRGAGRSGSHTRYDNTQSHGICLVGDYTYKRPAQRDEDALVWLIGHGASQGWWPEYKLTGGHRDAPHANTICPGTRAHQLIPSYNQRATPSQEMTWEEFMETLTEKEQEALKNFASEVVKRRTNGASIVRQVVEYTRGGNKDVVDEIRSHIKDKGSSLQGFVRGSINLFRYARDEKGYKIDTK